MASALTNAALRELKARSQQLEPAVRLGKEGASEAFYRALDDALARHQLVKVKFAAFEDEKKTLIPQIAEQTGSQVVMQVGHVAVFFRAAPAGEAA